MPAPTDTSQINGERYPTLTVPTIGPWPKFQTPLRLGVMASGSGTNFEALQASISAGDLDAELRLLVVNRPGCGAKARAERLGIACELLDHRQFASREALDHELVRTFQAAGVEAVVMAGWMRIVTPVLIDAFPGKLINIHPSLLPSFKGMDAVGQSLQAGVRITGCSVLRLKMWMPDDLARAAVPVLPGDDRSRLHASMRGAPTASMGNGSGRTTLASRRQGSGIKMIRDKKVRAATLQQSADLPSG